VSMITSRQNLYLSQGLLVLFKLIFIFACTVQSYWLMVREVGGRGRKVCSDTNFSS
jgi:hypothetical protein